MALEFRAGPLISAGECEIGIIASETMPKIVVLCCASGAAMRIQSREKTTVMEYMKNIAQWELNTWGDN
jgi:hypothetical protein